MNLKKLFLLLMIIFAAQFVYAQQSIYEPADLEDVEYSLTDFGKMWTFDDIPFEYWEKEYEFTPSEEWLDDVQKSALQFGNGCSAAFVSPNGLIMTNHHCGRGGLASVTKEGEDLMMDGFYAETLTDERRIPGFFVDQLIEIEDVTGQIISAMNEGKTDSAKVEKRNSKIEEIENGCKNDSGLICKVVVLYNGGKYSLYKYKRYNDIRLVMSPEFQIASTGWDWDNFTYPRYELDFMFLRAYDSSGNPVKPEHYFSWSENGAEEGEPIFVVGRPGNTDRLLSVAELKYLRDNVYPHTLSLLNGMYNTYFEMYEKYPERESELLNRVMGVGNARKVYAGMLDGLNDEYLMKRKEKFEEDFKKKTLNDPDLEKQYGNLWSSIEKTLDELKDYIDERIAFRRYGGTGYFNIAREIVEIANQLKLPEPDREPNYREDSLDSTIDDLFPAEFDEELNDKLSKTHLLFIAGVLGEEDSLVQQIFKGEVNEETVQIVLDRSELTSPEKTKSLFENDPDEILNSEDPFIYFLVNTEEKLAAANQKIKEIENTLQVLNQRLGELSYKVYGDEVPPDATITLRISDGVIAPYEYNGTLAPGNTTYFGMYDRFYSFDQETYPWGLPDKWKNPPDDFDLSTPLNFASTNDIVGGNSGSSMINRNAEVIGLVFDGNMESLPGKFIFLPESNRAIAVDSRGLMEALKKIYKADRLVEELKN